MVLIGLVHDNELRRAIRDSLPDTPLTFVEAAAVARAHMGRGVTLLVDLAGLADDDLALLAGAGADHVLALADDVPQGDTALAAGADDYLLKAQVGALLARRLRLIGRGQERGYHLDSQYILENTGDGMLIVDNDGIIRFCNPAAARLLGQPAAALIGRVFGYPIAVEDPTEIDLFPPRSDKPRVVELRAVEISWDGTKAHLATLRDMTERIAAEQAVRLRDRAIQASSSAIFILDVAKPDWRLTFANPAFEQITGYRIAHAIGQPYSFLRAIHEQIPDSAALLDKLEHDHECNITTLSWHQSGERYWSELRFSPIYDDMRQLSHVVAVQNDITQAKLLEKERLQKEKVEVALRKERELNHLKDRFLEMMAHELHTPLTSIMLSHDMLKQYGERVDAAERNEFLDSIREETERLNNIVNDVLHISRSNDGGLNLHPETVDLVPFCYDLAHTLQEDYAKTHNVRFHSTERTIRTTADTNMLRRALSNVLDNAIKYSPGGGEITVSLSVADDADEHDEYVIVTVRDEGIGIPDEDKARLFDPFHRGSNIGNLPGTGLGLTLVRQIIRAHEGEIWVDSTLAQGTTVTLRLPIAASL